MVLGASAATAAAASQCEMFIRVAMDDTGDAPVEMGSMMTDRLKRALTANGVSADENYGQMLLTGKFSDLYKEQGAGSPPQVAVHTTLTLSIGDASGSAVFATKSFDLRGVGSSEQRAYINALRSLSPKNKEFEDFIKRASAQTVAYFDKNYEAILQRAELAAAKNDFEQALYYSTFIPQCSAGYQKASAATLRYFQQYLDHEGVILLRQARAEFAISPNAEGAAKAYALLAQISPDSSAYREATAFANEIKRDTKVEYNFEVHQKYEDKIGLERQRINAAKEIGVAFGKGNRNHTTNILWK